MSDALCFEVLSLSYKRFHKNFMPTFMKASVFTHYRHFSHSSIKIKKDSILIIGVANLTEKFGIWWKSFLVLQLVRVPINARSWKRLEKRLLYFISPFLKMIRIFRTSAPRSKKFANAFGHVRCLLGERHEHEKVKYSDLIMHGLVRNKFRSCFCN